ncbi:hypothetical protein [Spiroplasma endosymbiont of Crioceris asparagi]|uniref:hypothetical protein n=1 Tax=Spiroplasma endosymbiont of Crioceris asparagi TaxID=3066286 RepID=UPI0030D3F3C1
MRNNKKVIYNAGSMFNEAQIQTRLNEGKILRKQFKNMIIENPIDFDFNEPDSSPTMKQIFSYDFQALTDADYLIFEIDSDDSGTNVEYGLAVEQAIKNKEKYLFVVISNQLFHRGIKKYEIPGFGLNEMITGSFYYEPLDNGDVPQLIVCDSHATAVKAIEAIESGKTQNYREKFDIKNAYKNKKYYNGF